MGKFSRLTRLAAIAGGACLPVILASGLALAQGQGVPQASITLKNCNTTICNATDTDWLLTKSPATQSFSATSTSPVTSNISWSVQATQATTTPIFSVNGVITVMNTGSATATIGNIVVNLQKPRTGPNTGACRNVPWVSAAANVATAFAGDSATSTKIVAAGSQENDNCNSVQGPTGGGNYDVAGAQGTFTETAGSGTLEFTDADANTIWSITPEKTLAAGASITLLYTATFNNVVLDLDPGTSVRTEAIVTFGNAGARGGSGASAANIDIDGSGGLESDEFNVRSVPCRVTQYVPDVIDGNSTVTLKDTAGDVVVGTTTGTGSVSLSNFTTTIGGGDGTEDITGSVTRTVSVDATCDPPATRTVTNTAYLDGEDVIVTVQGPQTGENCVQTVDLYGVTTTTCTPMYALYEFTCVAAEYLQASANATVTCNEEEDDQFAGCTYTQGGYQGGQGVPSGIFDNNFITVFAPNGLTIGINDGTGPKHHALWNATPTGRTALKTFLAGGGPSTALTATTVNASSVTGGALSKQTATLTLNIGFGIVGPPPVVDASGFGGLKLCNLVNGSMIGSFTLSAAQATALNGKTVADVLADANIALGQGITPPYVNATSGRFGELNQIVTKLNESYDNCNASTFAVQYLCEP